MPLLPQLQNADEEPEEQLTDEQEREQALSVLFGRAMAGQIPGARPRKYWERQKLSPRHLRMIQMRAAGYKNHEIASMMGMTQTNVCIVLNQEDSKFLLAQLISYAADEVLDVRTRIKALSGEMLSHVVDVVRNTRNEGLKSKNAFALLDRAGYGVVEKRQIEVTARIDGDQAGNLLAALDEAMSLEDEIESDGRYTVLASDSVAHETSVAELDEPEAPAPAEEQVTRVA